MDNTTNDVIAEKQAVAKYNGFYVARYEAGYESSKVVSKKNKALYTNKSQTEFKTIAKTMYEDTNPNVRSAMCSGIQWDMIMKFVNKEKDGTGNVYDVRKYNENRHSGIIEISGNNLTDKVQNIYDLEGNAWEFVAEKNTTRFPWNTRGGMYSNYEDYNCASICCVSTGNANASVTVRLVMYIM